MWEHIYSSRCNRYDTTEYTQEQLVSLVRDALNAQWKVVFTTFADDEKPEWQMSNGQLLNGKHCYVVIARIGNTATTERGPPDHPKTCAQNGHKLRRRNSLYERLTGLQS